MKIHQQRLLFIAVFAFYSFAGFSQAPARIYGEYIGFGKGLGTKLTNTVKVVKVKKSLTKVTIEMTFKQGQTCELEGNAVWEDEQLTVSADGLEADKPCKLVLIIKNDLLTLKDTEGQCREVYCGNGGAFEAIKFKKKK